MKNLLLILLLMMVFPVIVNSQEIKIASSVLASGGNVIAGNDITLSKWRIGVVHQLTLNVMPNETGRRD